MAERAPDSYRLFQQAVRRLAEAAGTDLKDVARLAGMPQSQLSKYLTSKSRPGLDVVDRVAAALKVPVWQLFDDGTGPAPPPEHSIAECARRVCKAMESAIPEMACVDKQGRG